MIGWIIETLVAGTLLMLLVLCLRKPLRATVGPRIAYWIWALPLIRTMLPPLPGAWRWSSLFAPALDGLQGHPMVMGWMKTDGLPDTVVQHALVTATSSHGTTAALLPPTQTPGGAPLVALIIGIWAIGALVFLARHLIAHHRFCRALMTKCRTCRRVAGGKVRMIESEAAAGPLAFGLAQICRLSRRFPRTL
ncbi:hypothetical protein KY084_03645 [Stakelama sp. CBK3Z-3]|uniref:Peptidase M56 domain-containing protein n=1 Tax=Stakelama flava TaxID=2860338 RepID=A0ABS6XIG6_9SPHN|nr:M56 family metallopeptidase [Stakelama flava]MBW4329967.1 hypothetical protein [Stakelama flava]